MSGPHAVSDSQRSSARRRGQRGRTMSTPARVAPRGPDMRASHWPPVHGELSGCLAACARRAVWLPGCLCTASTRGRRLRCLRPPLPPTPAPLLASDAASQPRSHAARGPAGGKPSRVFACVAFACAQDRAYATPSTSRRPAGPVTPTPRRALT